jgi:hypothetical protein
MRPVAAGGDGATIVAPLLRRSFYLPIGVKQQAVDGKYEHFRA